MDSCSSKYRRGLALANTSSPGKTTPEDRGRICN